ncbi:hypothetical protein [Xenorhabdus hominickii]|uniref:Phage tail fibre adhesin Gp38 N-terminal domain-containing protein n=1 Tax=Xenorhabdus hominickii TaxID=351679 RepID=A0A1V0M461_XENHO|nr:hypothetical protein [Xenorhabdus hominickii]ARD69654.1 hypothetical protein [Xenorhabdus hominickii]PHM52368.1 hypothetical protein Xhom_04446 [Xenorhabdus hominickii]
MAINGGNVGSEVVKETGLRSMLEAGAKLGLKPTFKMSDFIGKSQGFKLTFGSSEWEDEYNYDVYDVYVNGVSLESNRESNLGAFWEFGGSPSGKIIFESMRLTQLYLYRDDWREVGVLIFKPHTIRRDLTVTIDGVSQVFQWRDRNSCHVSDDPSQPFIAKLKSGQTLTVSIK